MGLPNIPSSPTHRLAETPTGLHHVTAIASDPQRNIDFYVGLLGLRLVKRTINFDDPGTYHFYFGDAVGTPGTILTFFPWPGRARRWRGRNDGPCDTSRVGRLLAGTFARVPRPCRACARSIGRGSHPLGGYRRDVARIDRFETS